MAGEGGDGGEGGEGGDRAVKKIESTYNGNTFIHSGQTICTSL